MNFVKFLLGKNLLSFEPWYDIFTRYDIVIFLPHLVDVRSPPSLERRPHVKENSQSRPQRRERTRFNHIQSVELEREFHKNPYPGIQHRVELASKLAIDESRIQVRAILMEIFMGLI